MFDFFQIIDLKGEKSFNSREFSFLDSYLYNNIDGIEYIKKYDNSVVYYLERFEINNNFYEKDGVNIFLYGTTYTNNLFCDVNGIKAKIIYADIIYDLYKKYSDEVTKYIKGSFVLVIYDENLNEVKIISDRLNVLPLYYYYQNNILIISSSVRMILESGYVDCKFNNIALVQQLLFDYVLGTNTYFKDIFRINNGTIYIFSRVKGKIEKQYWKVEELYNEKLYSKSESIDLLSSQLYENTNLYCMDTDKVLVALTGGFDGRANLALLNRDPSDFLCYSYGMPGSQQIEIPKMIAKKLNINYNPVLLDDKYEREHDYCTLEAIEFSNGNAPILRSNYPYAYKNLRFYSDTIITGLFGSEVMRPLHNLGIMMNDYSEKLFLSKSPEITLKDILNDLISKNYLEKTIVEDCCEELNNYLYTEYFDKYKSVDKILRFFFFIIQEGVRKYFSQEIQIERIYVTTRFPFFDDDFVDLMFKTPFAGMYNGFLGKSKFKRRKGQLLYAYIFKKFKPELGKIILDRGYKPDDLLKPFPINYITIYRGVRKVKLYKSVKGNDTFNSIKWTKNFISDVIYKYKDNTGIFGNGIKDAFESKTYVNDFLKYSHFITLFKYFNSF